VKVVGVALATKPVYGNGQMASRKGEYFRRELSVNNAGGPVWLGVTVTSPGEPTVTGNLLVPRTPEVFTHDLDGNLTADGRWTYTWDAENRLLRVQSRSDTPLGSWRRVEWQYDALGRRIRQTTWSWLVQSNLWVVTEDLGMVSDPLLFGRHVIELNASNNALVRSYVWGLDLSGTMDGAGGVGGLLWVTLHTVSGPAAGTHFVAYDGNGNIVVLSAASDGSETARYEYGPFGEPIRVTGPARATLNPFRFSTKRTCNTTDLVVYEYRAYSPALGRWLSRDPIGELGFMLLGGGTLPITGMEFDDESNGAPISERGDENLYVFVGNDPISFLDILGLVDFRFEPVVGELSGMIVRAGHWGQPFNYADGSASSSSKSAHTFIKVWSGPTSRGSCNTVQFKGKYGDNAGAITVYAQDNCPGKYKIYFDLTYEIKTTGPRGNALLKVDKITESVVGRTATIKKKKMIAVIVNIPAKQEVSVLRYDPIISFPPEPRKRNSTGSIDFNVEVVRVKKLD